MQYSREHAACEGVFGEPEVSMSISERLKEKLSAIFRRKPSGKGPPLPAGSFVRSPIHPLRARLTTVSTCSVNGNMSTGWMRCTL